MDFRWLLQKIKKPLLWIIGIIIVLMLAAYIIFFMILPTFSTKAASVIETLTPPKLPELQTLNSSSGDSPWIKQRWLNQNWGNSEYDVSENTLKYHHIDQGTRTLPIPYQWFLALEAPNPSLYWAFLKENEKFSANEYLLRFGFIRGKKDPVYNPDGLPIGFSTSHSQTLLGLDVKAQSIGFTCAACHTGHFIHGEDEQATEYVIEGAPAMTDLGSLTEALVAALGQTALSSKLPIINGRFDRFARNVLGAEYSASSKLRLSQQLASVLEANAHLNDIIEVEEGFTRLDALNRIGNQVFSVGMNRRENYAPIDAPVNYPHIWTASWFNWVQYDASIMSPLVRNAGEALGVRAALDTHSPTNQGRFSSSIPMKNLIWLEKFLAGDEPDPSKEKHERLSGLLAPKWPESFPLDAEKAKEGKKLYTDLCSGCHLPPLDSEKVWKDHFAPIVYNNGKSQTEEKTLQLNIIPLDKIGTDPAQSDVLVNRTVNTSGFASADTTKDDITFGIGVDKTICTQDPNQVTVSDPYQSDNQQSGKPAYSTSAIKDGSHIGFGVALGAVVEQTIDAWIDGNGITNPETKASIKGGRPNCIQAGLGYKSRPLNGVWATAPFLHNGSVATLKDLLCPTNNKRPNYVLLGDIDFDATNVGLKQPEDIDDIAEDTLGDGRLYTDDGYFILDTSLAGNLNTGHHFDERYQGDKNVKGVIGPKLAPEQCEALIEYVKTL